MCLPWFIRNMRAFHCSTVYFRLSFSETSLIFLQRISKVSHKLQRNVCRRRIVSCLCHCLPFTWYNCFKFNHHVEWMTFMLEDVLWPLNIHFVSWIAEWFSAPVNILLWVYNCPAEGGVWSKTWQFIFLEMMYSRWWVHDAKCTECYQYSMLYTSWLKLEHI